MTEVAVKESSIQRCAHDKENPYLMLSVGVTRDPRLSIEDLGFLTVLLDHPNNFKFNVPYLVKRCKLSKEKTRKLLNRLIELGYVIANQIRSFGKFLGMIYRVFEKPLMLVNSKPECKQKVVHAVEEKSRHGLTVNGEIDTNKYDDELSTRDKEINNSVCISSKDNFNLKVKIDDQYLKNALLIRNCKPIKDQVLLDAYLAEFNKNSDQYSHLSVFQRINNLAIFIKRCIDHHKENASKPKGVEKKEQQQITSIKTIKQAFFFAKQLTSNAQFSGDHSYSGESQNAFEGRIRQNLLNEKYFNEYRPYLIQMALISDR